MLALFALLSLLIAAGLAVDLQRRLQRVSRLNLRNEAAISEAQLMVQIRSQLAAGQAIAENVVEGGTSTVRAVHKGIAGIPFGILESIPVTRDTTRVVRRIHDAISDGVYNSISATNKALHQAARNAGSKPQLKQDDVAGELPKDPPEQKK